MEQERCTSVETTVSSRGCFAKWITSSMDTSTSQGTPRRVASAGREPSRIARLLSETALSRRALSWLGSESLLDTPFEESH